MNTIATFRKCTLSDEELLRRVDQLTDLIYQTGRIPTRHVPALPNEDYDLLVGELVLRFEDVRKNVLSKYEHPERDCSAYENKKCHCKPGQCDNLMI